MPKLSLALGLDGRSEDGGLDWSPLKSSISIYASPCSFSDVRFEQEQEHEYVRGQQQRYQDGRNKVGGSLQPGCRVKLDPVTFVECVQQICAPENVECPG